MTGHELIALAFAISNALRLVSYAPQIWRVARDRSGAQAISCLTWNLWVAANVSTAVYAWTHLNDWMLTAISAGNAVCCASVVLLTWVKRARHAAASTPATHLHREPVMTSKCCPHLSNLPKLRRGAGTLALGVVAASVVGALMLVQSMSGNAQAAADVAAVDVPTPTETERLDAGVDWSRAEVAADEPGMSVAAYER